MKKFSIALLLAILTGSIGVVKAQNPPQPDCTLPINLTAAGSTGNFDNRFIGCDTWTLNYAVSGFTGLTITFQSATGATLATIGAFGTYTGTVVTGINPNTNTTGRITQFQNGLVITPWLRVNLSGLTGSGNVAGVVYGYKTGYTGGNGGGGSSTCAGTVATPCVVDGPAADGAALSGNPNLAGISDGTDVRSIRSASNVGDANAGTGIPAQAQSLFNGATWDRSIRCNNLVVIDDSSMGLTTIIAASGSTKVYVCKFTITTAAAVDVQLFYGTGAACVTTSTALGGLYQQVSAVAEDFIADQSPLTTPASQAVCLSLGAGTRTTGQIQYAQF